MLFNSKWQGWKRKIMAHSGYTRITAIDRFEDTLRRARRNRLWDKITKRRKTLLPFAPIHSKLLFPNGIFQGVKEIPVERILGSLSKESEFDRDFRPIYKKQRERWVNVWTLHAHRGWEPISVHQIGDIYFVEDGHHRTSVARDLGLRTIEAAVTVYPVPILLNPNDSLNDILAILENYCSSTKQAQLPACTA